VKFAVGDAVVYAAHGAGRVAAREQRTVLGVEQEVVVLELGRRWGLDRGFHSSSLVGHGARREGRAACIRHRLGSASEADVQRVQQTLHEEGETAERSWHQRLKQGRAKLASGDPLELAELVRDGMRHQSQARKGAAPKLSETERRLYVQARELLTRGVACSSIQASASTCSSPRAEPISVSG
jgi:CarD family transcriptional regulator